MVKGGKTILLLGRSAITIVIPVVRSAILALPRRTFVAAEIRRDGVNYAAEQTAVNSNAGVTTGEHIASQNG